MNYSRLQLALREWRAHLTHPTALVILLAAIGMLALIGPFGVNELISLPVAVVYWAWLVLSCYSIGFLVNQVLTGVGWRRFALSTFGIGVLVTLVVLGTNAVVFGFVPPQAQFVRFVGTTFAICAIVNGVFFRLDAMEQAETAAAPALLDRLPLDKRGALVTLSVEDHYVRVQTELGEEMILMRLSDAIRETAPVAGLQVHRSHWVALDQVRAARREGDRAILTMTTGADVPVSRANVAAIRDAGLLSK